MAGIDSRAAVEQYLQALDQGIIDTIKGLGADGKEFALWDTINRCAGFDRAADSTLWCPY